MKIETKDPTATWSIKNESEWAIFMISEKSGVVMIYSSFGTFGHCWRAIGDRSLVEFIAKINFDYAMGKFLGSREEVDEKRSLENLKRSIISGRRHGKYDAEQARECWDDLMDRMEESQPFGEGFWDTRLAELDPDWYESITYGYPGWARRFWDVIWVPFVTEVATLQAAQGGAA